MFPIRSILLLFVLLVLFFIFGPEAPLNPVSPGDAVVVTGASSGIGKHAALSLALEGFTVFAGVRRDEDGKALLESADRFGLDPAKIKPLILDVTKSDQIAQAAEDVSNFVGERGLKGLFNNAGIGSSGDAGYESVESIPMSEYRNVFDVNIFGLIEVTKAFLPLLRKGKGRIINNSSVAGFLAGPFVSAYTSSKHAVEGFSDSLRRELLMHGVAVSVLEPGFIATKIFSGSFQEGQLAHEGVGPFAKTERDGLKQFLSMAVGAPTPKVTSQAVIHAMLSQKPKLRYRVGKEVTMALIMAWVPASWVDAMMSSGKKLELSEEEIRDFVEKSATTEFEL